MNDNTSEFAWDLDGPLAFPTTSEVLEPPKSDVEGLEGHL